MDTMELMGATLGLGFVAGVRLYATVLALGLAIRFKLIHFGVIGEPRQLLAHPAVLIAARVAYQGPVLSDPSYRRCEAASSSATKHQNTFRTQHRRVHLR
jgi:hypothetical protein